MINFGKCMPDEAAEAARLLHFIFMNYEPMTICNKLDPEKNLLLMHYLMDYQAKAGLAIVARDTESNRIIGVLTHRDYTLSPSPNLPKEYYPYISMFEADMAMCHELEKPLWDKEYKPGELFQPFQIAVQTEYSGLGIATELAARSVKLGKELGFREAIGECSVMGSRRAFEKSGFELINSLKYKDFEYNGSKPYESLDGELYLLFRQL